MKLNSSILRGKMKTYLQSDKFQKQYAEQVIPQKVKWYWDINDVENIVKKLKREIWLAAEILVTREYSGSSRLAGASPDALLTHHITNIQYEKPGGKWIVSCRVELFFNPDFVRSSSLYPERYPDGVDNLVRLLTNGWDFRRRQDRAPSSISNLYRSRMHGDWHLGSPKSSNIIPNVYAVSYRRGSSILFSYIDAFNREINSDSGDARGVFATLSESYAGAYGIGGVPFGHHTMINAMKIDGIGTIRFGLKM